MIKQGIIQFILISFFYQMSLLLFIKIVNKEDFPFKQIYIYGFLIQKLINFILSYGINIM